MNRGCTLLPQFLAETDSLHVRHHIEEVAGRFARIVEPDDVRVRESRGECDLAKEPLGAQRGSQFRPQDLDGDLAPEL